MCSGPADGKSKPPLPLPGLSPAAPPCGCCAAARRPALSPARPTEPHLEPLCWRQALYKELQASWLTPVEIFQPHYGRAIAACILGRWRQLAASAAAAGRPAPPLRIYEIGGGTGTLARNVLVRSAARAAAVC